MAFLLSNFQVGFNRIEDAPTNGLTSNTSDGRILAEGFINITSVEYNPISPVPGSSAEVKFHCYNTGGAAAKARMVIKINDGVIYDRCYIGGTCLLLGTDGVQWSGGATYSTPSGAINVEVISYHEEGWIFKEWVQDEKWDKVLNADVCTGAAISVDKTEVYNGDDVEFTITRTPVLRGISGSVMRGTGAIGTCSTDSSGQCKIKYRMALPLGTYTFYSIFRNAGGSIECTSNNLDIKVIDKPATEVSFTVNDLNGTVEVAKNTNFKVKVKGEASTTYGFFNIGLIFNDLLKEGDTDSSGNWEFDYKIDKNETIDTQIIKKDCLAGLICDKSNKITLKVGDGGGGGGTDPQILIDDKSGSVNVGKNVAFSVKVAGAANTTYGFFEAGLVLNTLLHEATTDATGNVTFDYTINEDKTIDVFVIEKCGGLLCKESNKIKLVIGKGSCDWTDIGCSVGRSFGVDPLIVYAIVALILIVIIIVILKGI